MKPLYQSVLVKKVCPSVVIRIVLMGSTKCGMASPRGLAPVKGAWPLFLLVLEDEVESVKEARL